MSAYPVFPACAGVSLLCPEYYSGNVCFPRVCGGEPASLSRKKDMNQFSPRVRG